MPQQYLETVFPIFLVDALLMPDVPLRLADQGYLHVPQLAELVHQFHGVLLRVLDLRRVFRDIRPHDGLRLHDELLDPAQQHLLGDDQVVDVLVDSPVVLDPPSDLVGAHAGYELPEDALVVGERDEEILLDHAILLGLPYPVRESCLRIYFTYQGPEYAHQQEFDGQDEG